MKKINIFWFRRDLRMQDNAGLYYALKSDRPVLCLFIFDSNILEELPKSDARVGFIHDAIANLHMALATVGTTILVLKGEPEELWKNLVQKYDIGKVFCNRDYEPYALERDDNVKLLLQKKNITLQQYKDQVIFEKEEVLKKDNTPYTVFTPYSRKWYEKLNSRGEGANSFYLKAYPCEKYFDNFYKTKPLPLPSLEDIGFVQSSIKIPDTKVTRGLIRDYERDRDFPGINGTSRLGVHFRFGTISIREKASNALGLSKIFVNELIWRDFYAMILSAFPHVVSEPFREKYKMIPWRNNKGDFEKWCAGETGYPMVDAGMRELNATGFMHNRVRMVTASFLTKHLLIDWRWGEAYFAEKLLDFDLASNNGGWQWAAGCGTDAAPYFRIFNPASQQKKFDKALVYIKKWVPEFGTDDYPAPVVEHKFARERCLKTYKEALAGVGG